MKKLIFGVFLSFLCACAHVEHDIENIKPNEAGFDDSFVNKIFSISCKGTDGADPKDVSTKCREYASKFAFEKGYSYFSVLDENSGSNKSIGSYTTTTPVTTYSNSGGHYAYGYGTSTTYVPQTHIYSTTSHYKNYAFVLINENELKQWKNYFKVSDYYIPKESQ
ncbi:MAG: hypothetical protein FWE50_02175 [Alphaproteobacteria bacterium]|nr:hypothetical protein [Alphaproteobacteria bacterium]